MWRRFWFGAEAEAQGADRRVEPFVTGWVPAQQLSVPAAAEPTPDQAAEAAAFLDRVYTHQQC